MTSVDEAIAQEARDSEKPNKVCESAEKVLLRAYSMTPHQASSVRRDYKMQTPALEKCFVYGKLSPSNGPFMDEKKLFAASAIEGLQREEGIMSQLTKS